MATVYNSDVAGIYRRINRFIVELVKSQSSGVGEMIPFDQVRLASYLNAIDGYVAWVVGQPSLDLPETNPRTYVLEDPPGVPAVESEEVRDVVTLLELARDELINSQSARLASNIKSFDQVRLTAIVAKARKFLETYIVTVTPLDNPESSPMRVVSGHGLGGV